MPVRCQQAGIDEMKRLKYFWEADEATFPAHPPIPTTGLLSWLYFPQAEEAGYVD